MGVQRVLDMMWEAVRATGEAFADVLLTLPPWSWGLILGSLLLLLLASLLRGAVGRRRGRPEVMLSRAELAPDENHEGYFRLVAAFSNLHHEPVQLLRIVVTGGDRQPRVVETTALVGPRRAVELEAVVPIAPGGSGRLDLYMYAPSAPARAWRVRVPLGWEPWSNRFKASPLAQTLVPVKRMPDNRAPKGGAGAEDGSERGHSQLDFPDDF